MLIGICSLTTQDLGLRDFQIQIIKNQIQLLGITKGELFDSEAIKLLSGVGEYEVVQLGPKQKAYQFSLGSPDLWTLIH